MPTVHPHRVAPLAVTTSMRLCQKKNHHPVRMMAGRTLMLSGYITPLCPRGAGAMVVVTTGVVMFSVMACPRACCTPF